jgi:hypothetical protein
MPKASRALASRALRRIALQGAKSHEFDEMSVEDKTPSGR